MKVTREEVIKLAMRADINGQITLGANLRDVASCMDYERVQSVEKHIDWRGVDAREKRILLNMEEI